MKALRILVIGFVLGILACGSKSSEGASVTSTLECVSTDSLGNYIHYKATVFDNNTSVVYGRVNEKTNVQSYVAASPNYANRTIGVPLSAEENFVIETSPSNTSTVRVFHNGQSVTVNSNCK